MHFIREIVLCINAGGFFFNLYRYRNTIKGQQSQKDFSPETKTRYLTIVGMMFTFLIPRLVLTECFLAILVGNNVILTLLILIFVVFVVAVCCCTKLNKIKRDILFFLNYMFTISTYYYQTIKREYFLTVLTNYIIFINETGNKGILFDHLSCSFFIEGGF